MMRVLYDHQAFQMQRFGGVSYYYAKIIEGLAASVEAIVAVRRSGNEHLAGLRSHLAYPVLNSGFIEDFMFGAKFPGKNRAFAARNRLFPRFDATAVNAAASIAEIGLRTFDLFHPTYYDPYFLSALGGIPYVLTVHDCTHEQFPEFFGASDRTFHDKRAVLERASRIIAISETTKRDVSRFYGINGSRIDVIYLGIDPGELPTKPATYSPALPDRYLLYTGQRFHYKNWLFFVRAIAEVLLSYPDLKLVCTGPDFSPNERGYLADLGLRDRVVHLRSRFEDLPLLYANALAFVFPSLSEGFGLPILEAMVVGCPALLSDIAVMREIGSTAALYFSPKDMDSVRACVASVVDNPELRRSLSLKGKDRAADFSWDRACTQTLEVYQKAVETSI
jgi:glycosyltransferase involved in cell wall biosynthesis